MQVKIARVCTVPFFAITQLGAAIQSLQKAGSEVVVVASDDGLSKGSSTLHGAEFVPVEMSRSISPVADLRSLIALYVLFRSRKFDIVHSNTPKAGLLCAIAGWMARVPVRLHTFTGQPWVTMNGFKKTLLKTCDRVIGLLDTCCYTDGPSQRDFLVKEKIAPRNRLLVLGEGSVAGVDLGRFDPARYSDERRVALRDELGVAPTGKVILFVGRITKDKGIGELLDAFIKVVEHHPDTTLLLVGPYEHDGEALMERVRKSPAAQARVVNVGFTSEPEKYMAMADLLCLPSYREGFGTVVIEAAAMGIPSVVSNIYGLEDAVVDNVTGILVPPKDSSALALALSQMLSDDASRLEMAQRAKKRAEEQFDSVLFSGLLIDEYRRIMAERSGPAR